MIKSKLSNQWLRRNLNMSLIETNMIQAQVCLLASSFNNDQPLLELEKQRSLVWNGWNICFWTRWFKNCCVIVIVHGRLQNPARSPHQCQQRRGQFQLLAGAMLSWLTQRFMSWGTQQHRLLLSLEVWDFLKQLSTQDSAESLPPMSRVNTKYPKKLSNNGRRRGKGARAWNKYSNPVDSIRTGVAKTGLFKHP